MNIVSNEHWNYFKVGSIVTSYILVSTCMIVVNKLILNNFGELPISFLVGQLAIACVVLKAFQILKLLNQPKRFNANDYKNIAPLILINVIGLMMNTLCLKYVDAAIYQVARSLVLPFTLFMTIFFNSNKISNNSQQISINIIFACLVIFIGFLVGMNVESQIKLNYLGLVFSILSSFTTSIHSIIIKNSLNNETESRKTSTWELVYLNNLFSSLLLSPFCIIFEWSKISNLGQKQVFEFLISSVMSGIIGLLINYTSFLQIHVTSPLTHTVSSATRGIFQSMVAHFVLNEEITKRRIIGILITLLGTTFYSIFKALNL
jgi:solute carrier family 35 (GDP-fucose transporter), member C1